MEKMYYNGREIVAITTPNLNVRSCEGCVFDEDMCTNWDIVCWGVNADLEYVEGIDVIFKYKEEL